MADWDPGDQWHALARHEVALATVRMFTDAAHAARVAVLLDTGDGRHAALIECEPGEPLALTEGEETVLVPADTLQGVVPLPLVPPPAVPPSAVSVDVEEGLVEAPVGAVANLALAVLELAKAFGGRTVATADFETRTGGPLTIAARPGEPLVMALGEHQFELPAGWPDSGGL